MNRICLYIILIFLSVSCAEQRVELKNREVGLEWSMENGVWKLSRFETLPSGLRMGDSMPSLFYSVLYTAEKPSGVPEVILKNNGDTLKFLEEKFKFIRNSYNRSVSAVPLNRAGKEYGIEPREMWKEGDKICFRGKNELGILRAEWRLDESYPGDIKVKLVFKATVEGYFSLPSPTVVVLPERDLKWGVVPGFFQGDFIQKDFPLAYVYGQGLPEIPVICRENTVTTMASVLSSKNGVSLAVIPEPGYDRNAYGKDETKTHGTLWKTGLSHKNYRSQLCPTAYHPVLGEEGSHLTVGDSVCFEFRYTLARSDWYRLYKHAIYAVYKLKRAVELKQSSFSLTDRLFAVHDYVVDDKLSLWRVEDYRGMKIGAQSYLGGVVESDKDAMKNSDVGAAWMLAAMTGDKALTEKRLPYMRNFKLVQQGAEGKLSGAALGQYYLYKKKKFVEEWGDHLEPVGLTYYTLIDIGNILLFEPDDKELKEKLRAGAERLLAWQKADGSFDVAYNKKSLQPIYTDLTDLRPTFYGFTVAYDILKDSKYLDAAKKSADWYIDRAVKHGCFLGVCGDARFINDFATGQSVQALLEIFRLTGNVKYKEAAVEAARMYTCSIYTHAMASDEVKKKNGVEWKDWQLTQVGLSFEHGGSTGSAVPSGPILLSSHCGMFVRMFELTEDSLFLDMARAGAIGREAFLNPETKIATYYWSQFDRGPGPFPHHAWWQMGWISDYLMAEAEMRSGRKIDFPRGFITPKVGPQQIYGFKPGEIYGIPAHVVLRKGLVETGDANIDVLTAVSEDGRSLFVILLNNSSQNRKTQVKVNQAVLGWSVEPEILCLGTNIKAPFMENGYDCELSGFGIHILKISKK